MVLFVVLYSILPHKELRFIFYVFPVLNIFAALGLKKLNSYSIWLVWLILLGSLMLSGCILYLSYYNYPGGDALNMVHQIVDKNDNVHLHISVPAAMTGVTRFGQINANWIYNKTEDLSIEEIVNSNFTHLLSIEDNIPSFHVIGETAGYASFIKQYIRGTVVYILQRE